jgi:caa(3)-type oxidase subunit IV
LSRAAAISASSGATFSASSRTGTTTDNSAGEASRSVGRAMPHAALWALAYLIVFGSLVAYSSYVYALKHLPVSTVSLYAYINPIIAVALGIAVAKAALVVLFFMQLRRPDPLLRLAAAAALVFMAFLFTLTFADVLGRAGPTQPGTVMPRSIPEMPATGQRAF